MIGTCQSKKCQNVTLLQNILLFTKYCDPENKPLEITMSRDKWGGGGGEKAPPPPRPLRVKGIVKSLGVGFMI